jgi:hypothetical protein
MENKGIGRITKKVYRKFLESLLENSVPGPEIGGKIILEIISFLGKNYENMDEEMQKITDGVFSGFQEQAEIFLKEAPDVAETREAKRLLRSMKHELPTAKGLIAVMESKAEIKEPIVLETRNLFEKHFQSFLDVLYDISVEESHKGEASFAKLSLLFSCVDELVTGFHLAQRAYSNQAYSHIRTVLESLNKIELFVRDESYAKLWLSNDEKEKFKKLRPKAVRDKLGIKKDELYGFLSVYGTHVTSEYVHSKSGRYVKVSESGNPEIVFFISGTKYTSHILTANLNCLVALSLALVYVGKAFPHNVHSEDYSRILGRLSQDLREYMGRYIGFFKKTGFDIQEIEAFINNQDFWRVPTLGSLP